MDKRILMWTAALAGGGLLWPALSLAADVSGEIKTAAQHAALAATASDVAGVRMHLHHALNCLEGPKGADFTTKEINPCQNSGNGAIPDSENPTTNAKLELAVSQARAGIAAGELATAQKDARSVADTLNAIK